MSDREQRPNIEPVLAGLKDFQRLTVDHAFRRLYLDEDSSHRFLVADEVGLGKTLVARGVIAKTVDLLWDQIDRIDIVYICSNADIARQNIKRLGIGADEFSLPSRITLLPVAVQDLDNHRLNFISFTPNTSFNLRSNLGTMDERALLYLLLRPAWDLGDRSGPINLMQGMAGRTSFRNHVRWFRQEYRIDEELGANFIARLGAKIYEDWLAGRPTLRERFDDLSDRFQYSRKRFPEHDRLERNKLVGDLRSVLAETCLEALEPDLIILDEFQRFKHLLSGDDASSELARELFEYADPRTNVRVLLLSATPYKMFTLSHEHEEDHYADFVTTLDFLLRDTSETRRVEELLRSFRQAIFMIGQERSNGVGTLRSNKNELEVILRRVMVRTERLASTSDRNGMLTEIPDEDCTLHDTDLSAYLGLQEIAASLGESNLMEYWKSAPYLLDFMDHYKFKETFRFALESPDERALLSTQLAASIRALFPWDAWRAYQEIDPANARLRSLHARTINAGAWRLLWIPPSLLYYQPVGVFAEAYAKGITKHLVFSSWQVVPKVIASILSYGAERNMVHSNRPDAENTPNARQRLRPPLRFAMADERPTGMPVFALLYPSLALAQVCDPITLTSEDGRWGGSTPTLQDAMDEVKVRIQSLLDAVPTPGNSAGPEDDSWYWAAPILFDIQMDPEGTRSWFDREDLATIWSSHDESAHTSDDATHWYEHVNRARELVQDRLPLGRQPADLVDVLARLAIAGPGTAILRALSRSATTEDEMSLGLARDVAAHTAWGFRALFNLPEVTQLVRSLYYERAYWRSVLEYCADGNLQAVLDEYTHVLGEYLGVADRPRHEAISEVANTLFQALTLRTATIFADEITPLEDGDVQVNPNSMRVRFALRYGDQQSDQANVVERAGAVRAAFNSPFWPFVLATTSVGQEGLDFHLYCHAVVHWNLPSNPVDLEQREGRVHRYKNHAVRKNLASVYGQKILASESIDAWERLFAAATSERGDTKSELEPYWIFPVDGGAQIERHVPALPLSRDRERLVALRRALTLYRMAFGQPRQEDLVEFLAAHVDESELDSMIEELRVDLSPDARPRDSDGYGNPHLRASS